MIGSRASDGAAGQFVESTRFQTHTERWSASKVHIACEFDACSATARAPRLLAHARSFEPTTPR